jgi:hypothetical protein
MTSNDPSIENVRLHKEAPTEESHLVLEDAQAHEGVQVVVTQIFCPKGHNLVGLSREAFDGHPGISLRVDAEHASGGAGPRGGEVILSPIHGDREKRGVTFPDGTKLAIRCPVCETRLPELTRCSCSEHGRLLKLYLTPTLSEAHLVAVCDIWGCPRSRVIDNFEMFSEFLAGNIGDGE